MMGERSLNLVYVCFSTAWGGLEMKTLEIAEAMEKRGHRAVIIAPHGSPLLDQARRAFIATEEVTPQLRYFDIVSAFRLQRMFRTHRADIITVGFSRDLSTCLIARNLARRGHLVFYQQMQAGGVKRDWFHRWTYGNLGAWITLTQAMKRATLQNTTVHEDRVFVVPLGSDLTRFDPAKYDGSAKRQAFGLPKDRFTVGVIGRIDPQKGQEHLVRAIAIVRRTRTDVHLAIIGEETRSESGHGAALQRVIEQLGMQDIVSIHPFTDDVPGVLSALDLLVLPSLSETLGNILIEAMAMSVPVIGTDAGGVPEIITHEMNGLLVRPANPEALAAAILRMMNDAALRHSCAQSGRATAIAKFDIQSGFDAMEHVYQGLAAVAE